MGLVLIDSAFLPLRAILFSPIRESHLVSRGERTQKSNFEECHQYRRGGTPEACQRQSEHCFRSRGAVAGKEQQEQQEQQEQEFKIKRQTIPPARRILTTGEPWDNYRDGQEQIIQSRKLEISQAGQTDSPQGPPAGGRLGRGGSICTWSPMSHPIALIHTWTTADLDGVWEGPPEFHWGSIVDSRWKDGSGKY